MHYFSPSHPPPSLTVTGAYLYDESSYDLSLFGNADLSAVCSCFWFRFLLTYHYPYPYVLLYIDVNTA